MDIFGQESDPFLFDSSSSIYKQEISILSDASTGRRTAHSDEEVHVLATSRPKKRAGRRVFKETRHPIFRGVRKRNNNKWVCELREPNKKSRIWLGTYPTPEMAARAHDVAALALRGKNVCLNFADSAWRLPVPVSKEAKDIRRAASEAAEMFRPREFGGEAMQNLNVYGAEEEAVFDDTAGLLADMAQGPLMSPPHDHGRDCISLDDLEIDVDVSLWSYSI